MIKSKLSSTSRLYNTLEKGSQHYRSSGSLIIQGLPPEIPPGERENEDKTVTGFQRDKTYQLFKAAAFEITRARLEKILHEGNDYKEEEFDESIRNAQESSSPKP